MHPQAVGGKRWQQKADDGAKQHHRNQFCPKADCFHRNGGNHWGQRRTVKRNIHILGKVFVLKAGKQINAQNNRPDVCDIFTEHRKAGHQKDAGDGRTADAGMAELYNADGSCHNDARIEEGRTKAAHRAVIGDEGIGV